MLTVFGADASRAQNAAARVLLDQPPVNVKPPVPPAISQTLPAPTPVAATGSVRTLYFQKPADPFPVKPAQAIVPPEPDSVKPMSTAVAREPVPVSQTRTVAQFDVQPKPKPFESKTTFDDLLRYQIRLEPPGPELVFRLDSEAALEQRMRQEAKQQNLMDTVVFPEKPTLSKVAFQGRTFPQQVAYAEPRYVNYRRLLFEERNAERYGWDFGIAQPFVSTLYFCRDMVMVPHNLVSYPLRRYETSAGYCLPGDPVPYILYPPEFTKEGLLAELGVGTALFLMFP